MKQSILFILRVLGLSLLWMFGFVFLTAWLLPKNPEWTLTAAQQQSAVRNIALMSLINTSVACYLIVRSRWSGWRLSGAIFLIYFGAMSLLSQIEAAVFPAVNNQLPPNFIVMELVAGALLTAFFAPIAVFVMGKWHHDPAEDEPNERLEMPASEWLWKLALIVIAYEILYFTFGYFIAWRTPAVHEFYGGTDPGSFPAQMANVMRDTPWLPFFQVFRALLWTLIALPIIRSFKGSALETGIAVGLAYAMFMNTGLLVPNPIMPDAVRAAHFVETASSNFIFGLIVGGLLSSPVAERQLSGRQLSMSLRAK